MIMTTPSYKYTSCVSTELQQNTNNNYVHFIDLYSIQQREKTKKNKENTHNFVNL